MVIQFTSPSLHNTYRINSFMDIFFGYVQESYPISDITQLPHKSTCISLLLILTQLNIPVANKYISANTIWIYIIHSP